MINLSTSTGSISLPSFATTVIFPPAYFKSPFADWIIHIVNSQFGQFYFLNEFTSSYRLHDAGVWGGIKEEKQLQNKLQAIECIREILLHEDFKNIIGKTRKTALQKICAYYKQHGQLTNYLMYRTKLMLN